MRVLLLALSAALVAAGCVSQPAAPGPSAPADPHSPPRAPPADDDEGPAQHAADVPGEDPTFCSQARGCDFWDDDYHEYVLYEVDSMDVDVLIVPSASRDAAQDTPAIRAAVEAWETGIAQLATSWMADGFNMDVYLLGTDRVPQEALDDPEIVVLAAEYNPVLLFGIGYQLPPTPCRGAAVKEYAPHEHHGMSIRAAQCEEGGFTCMALNTNFLLGSKTQLYDLVAHEVGHCLGVGHVGDALDFSAKRVPVDDIMSYQETPTQVHCVSTLNVRVLEALHAPLVGETVSQPVQADDYYTMPRSQYSQVDCPNP